MMKIWRKTGFDAILREAYESGIVCAGLSAGANCWFERSHSDSYRFSRPDAPYALVRGLAFLEGTFCPHYDAEPGRKPDLAEKIARYGGTAYGVENCAALAFEDGRMTVVTSKPDARAYRIERVRGAAVETELKNLR